MSITRSKPLITFWMMLFVLTLGMLASACSGQQPAAQGSPTLDSQGSGSITHLPTDTILPSETPTLAPSITSSPTPSIIPTLTPNPSPARPSCWEEGGRIEQSVLRSNFLPLPMEFRVYLPPCYDQLLDHSYPVLYLIHGQNFNDDQWDRLGIDEMADQLIEQGEISPLIIVMPRDRSWSQPTEDMFGQVVIEQLLPEIDQLYRTRASRVYRAVGGLSRGAGWALHLGLSQWESFGTIGLHSLPVFWTDLPDIKNWLDSIPPGSLPRIYMDLGDRDRPQITKSAIWFEELLTEKRIPHEWHLYPGYHEEAYWEEHIEEYLLWYTQNW
jgi:enterochelin esterase-like enzyme